MTDSPTPEPSTAASGAAPDQAPLNDPQPVDGAGSPAPWADLALQELRERRDRLEREIAELENRRAMIERESTSSFAGQADAISRRLKGFQDYLVGALQGLAVAAEQIELVPQQVLVQPSPLDAAQAAPPKAEAEAPVAAAGLFAADEVLIRERLASVPGPARLLRRSLEAAPHPRALRRRPAR